MTNNERINERINAAIEKVLDETCMEIVYRADAAPDFVEVAGECGGDVMCYRVYNDGGIYAK